MTGLYLDTSALAKWYLNEPQSEAFETFISKQTAATISRLTVVEFRCLLARRRRVGDISKALEAQVYAAFEADVLQGVLEVYPLEDDHLFTALALLGRLQKYPLRTLDALHLAIMVTAAVPLLATADRVMADAGKALGLEVVKFF